MFWIPYIFNFIDIVPRSTIYIVIENYSSYIWKEASKGIKILILKYNIHSFRLK